MKLSTLEKKELLMKYNYLNCWLSNKRTYPHPFDQGFLTYTENSDYFNVGFKTYDINRITFIFFGDITNTVYIKYN